ncbi:non-ribosomal peptide synthetase [Chitinophaga sp. Cy-1792]|uniref:non-ribosomal peptide synthetase n=1 Tax=Chitinophaga sp. Cy-1792 TaxID=2608339 RepID=UPI0019651CF2|nr:non-ribosomal peptide synthetase [Chitinophaga sp. Cy-1792]NIG56805.1 amino acid adenylation domain-containing protein [Chitinophaga sp. Cy-1792]
MKVYNEYGPTETTVGCIVTELHPDKPVIIGKPISGTSIYILDAMQQLVPVGVTGEIYIAGAGVANGYLHQPELTAKKFVAAPFGDGLAYRTGDLARWLPDGNIVFIGRKDDQVKIRGYRIELGEIETAVLGTPGVETVVVLARSGNEGEKELAAYITGKELHVTDIRNYLSGILPAYMIPAHFVVLDELPLTTNGKVDRKRLPDPAGINTYASVTYVAPRTDAQIHLAAVLEEVLKKKQVGLRDDFFLLGGDSIKSIQVVSRLKQRGYSLKIQDVLLTPVVEQLSEKMELVTRYASQATVSGLVGLTPIQQYFLEQDTAYAGHYNQSVLLFSATSVAPASLQAALDHLWLHHDALRMVYRHEAGSWIQENKGADTAAVLEVLDYEHESAFAAACDRIQSSFRLSEGPLFKAALFRSADGDRLLLAAHHLVVDGVSWRILLDDLSQLYSQHSSGMPLQLPQKTDAYAWWSGQLQAYAQSEALAAAAPYWEQISTVSVPPLPLDHGQGSNQARDAVSQSFLLDSTSTTQLLTRCYSAYRTEVNDVLLSALGLALRETFGLPQALVTLEGHGREDIGGGVDVTRTVGWFTTLFPVLLDLEQPDAISQLIAVKEHLHRVPDKGIGYGVLRYLGGKKDELQPQIAFNYLGDFGTGAGSDEAPQFSFIGDYHGLEVAPERLRSTVLNVSGMVVAGQLRMTIGYSKAQFEEATVRRLLSSLEQQLQQLITTLAAINQTYPTPVDLSFKGLSLAEVVALNKDGDLEDVYPLSPLQEGLYYHWLTARGSVAYVEQMNCVIKGPLNIPALEESYARLSARHTVLRTHFTQQPGKGVLQVVKKTIPSAFAYVDEAGINSDEYRLADRVRGFDLHAGSQMRLSVLKLGPDMYDFVWSHHHTLMDGWCIGILIREYFEIYYSLLKEQEPKLAVTYPYADYISWLNRYDRKESLQYWKDYLAGYDTISSVPGTAANENKGYLSSKSNFVIDGPLRQSVKDLCGKLRITENTFFSTVWGILLGRYNDTNDVVFGSIVSGRPTEVKGVEEMIGLFINTIPVRVRMQDGVTVESLLKTTGQEAIEGVPHHYTQLAEVQSASELERGLFDHILQFQNFPVQQMVEADMERTDRSSDLSLISSNVMGHNAYHFTCIIVPGDSIVFMFKYNGNIYEETQIARLQEHITNLVARIVENPAATVSELDYLGAAEQQELLETFSHATNDYPSEKTIVDLFQQQVSKTPDAPALAFNDTVLSYRELDNKSDQLASYLLTQYNIVPDEVVGIMLDRSENMIIAILGILKAGGAYVAIEPDQPKARKAFIMQDTAIKALITQTDYVFELDYYNGGIYAIDIQLEDNIVPVKPVVDLHPANLAYVLYTSGSTGQPKGVMISHRSLVDYSYGVRAKTNIGSCKTFGLVSTISADLGNTVIYTSILMGGCLRIFSAVDIMSALRLSSANVDCMKIVPSHWKALQEPDRLFVPAKCLIFGGEQLTPDVLTHIRGHNGKCEVYNHYGPSEATIGKLLRRIDVAAPRISLGMPFCNGHVYVLDNQQRPCPIGVAGEICISGDGLAAGYLNQPELTASRFVSNPYIAGELIYKTGDLGRWLPDGSIAFLGRKDDQVKIRGYRIELDEITEALQEHPSVDTAVVLARDSQSGERELAAYYVSSLPLGAEELRTFLSKSLPSYMLPRYFVQLDAIPITSNGKINRKLLPDPETGSGRTGETYVAPETQTESQLIKIWEEVLGLTEIGVTTSFFNLGGNSLKIIKMSQLVNQVFGVTFSIDRFFEYLTVRDIAQAIEQQSLSGDGNTAAQETDVIIF